MKIQEAASINPFGGINFVIEELDKLKIGQVLNNCLPALAKQSRYDWRDILYSYWTVFYCGGDSAEDLSENFKLSLSQNPYLSIPSPDRVLNRLKQIAKPSAFYKPARAKYNHEFELSMMIMKRISFAL